MFCLLKRKQAEGHRPARAQREESLEDWEEVMNSQGLVVTIARTHKGGIEVSTYNNIKPEDAEPRSVDDLRSIHAIHATATLSHVLAPYPISGLTATLLQTTCHPDTPEGKARAARDLEFYINQEREDQLSNPYLPADAKIEVDLPEPRDRRTLRVVHMRGNTEEVPVDSDFCCDYTCPQYRETLSKRLVRVAWDVKKKVRELDSNMLF